MAQAAETPAEVAAAAAAEAAAAAAVGEDALAMLSTFGSGSKTRHAWCLACMVLMPADDFGAMDQTPGMVEPETPAKRAKTTQAPAKRDWLKVWETAPAQLLNAAGQSNYPKMSPEQVWKDLGQPQRNGAVFSTEYHSQKEERRGVAVNRWLLPVIIFCKYQKEDTTRTQNLALLNAQKCKELYDEIDRVLPSLEYCLAPKKQSDKKGVASLRSSSEVSVPESKPTEELCKHGSILYDWLSAEKPSRIRMLMNWQAAGGLPFVASVHHLCSRLFIEVGNSMHGEGNPSGVTLEEFTNAILSRHRVGNSGVENNSVSQTQTDYT